uniref:Nucleoplasmin-like domain-containing protein n=1 Tax=Paramoeba aestuarina TaxID=180227 RepID=A0A7S4KYF1_9EUKA
MAKVNTQRHIESFGIKVDKTKPLEVIPEIGVLHISQAALATPTPGTATLRITSEGKTFTLGILSADCGMCHMPLNMRFSPGDEFEFSVVGQGNTTVHITGYYETHMYYSDDVDDDAQKDLQGTRHRKLEQIVPLMVVLTIIHCLLLSYFV